VEGIPDIEPFRRRFSELDDEIAHPDFFQDQRRAATLSREQQRLSELIALYDECEQAERTLADNREMLNDGDVEIRKMAEEEDLALEQCCASLRDRLLLAMVPPDESDSRNTVMEIRAGAGGDEAALFAADLLRMYTRLAEENAWQIEQLGASPSESGGYKEVVFGVKGEDVYKRLKFESGVHRVQRVPVTEANGRIHTSTSTVAVLPEAQEVDVQIDPNDLEITVCRASGPGGQGVNTTDSAVQITHRPSGITVNCADERSQLKNKAKAMTVLRSRLLQKKQDEEREKYAENRRRQVGTGDRSERIRTYNFPQGRVTDHRIGKTFHSLPDIMDGKLSDLLDALESADYQIRVTELMDSSSD
jgi:peptide chain release factor 1